MLAAALGLLLLVALPNGPAVRAGTGITFTNPGAIQVTVGEGDDFATNVLRDPWDMDNARDIWFELAFDNVSASGGIWQGKISGIDDATGIAMPGGFYPLFQGFSYPIGGALSHGLNWDRVGGQDQYAIDSSKYSLLSYRLSLSSRGSFGIYWTGAKPADWPTADHYFAGFDGCYRGNAAVQWPAGWKTYYWDLNQTNGDPGFNVGAWDDYSLERGFRIDPNFVAGAGTEVKIDWIRLTDPATSPSITLSWTAPDAQPGDLVDIWVANDAAGNDAGGNPVTAPFIRGIPAIDGSYQFKTSALPPGAWYIQAKLMANDVLNNGCGNAAVRSATAWTGPLTIVAAPTVDILQPSMATGRDYATAELGNPWDMEGADDVVTPGRPAPQTLANESFISGVYSADASILLPGQPHSDSQIWLNTGSVPIDASKYRYFTIRLRVDPEPGKDISWHVAYGWGSRLIWWNASIGVDGSVSKFGPPREGWRTYQIDLGNATASVPSPPAGADHPLHPSEIDPYPAQAGWAGSIENLRFDPLETTQGLLGSAGQRFHIDYARLTAQDEVNQGAAFPIKYLAASATPQFFYTTSVGDPTQSVAEDASSGVGPASAGPFSSYLPGLLLASAPVPVASDLFPFDTKTFLWATSGVAPGPYFICGRVTDAEGNTNIDCSDAPVIVN